jgi:signal transduction histidine kinase
MNDASTYTLPGLRAKHQTALAVDVLLEAVAGAALLVEQGSGRIQGANLAAVELLLLGRAELLGMSIGQILPGWEAAVGRSVSVPDLANGPILPPAPDEYAFAFEVACPDGSVARLLATATALPKGKQLLVRLAASEVLAEERQEAVRRANFVANLEGLAAAAQTGPSGAARTLPSVLTQAVAAIATLTDAAGVALYLGRADLPQVQRRALWGEDDGLPVELPASDLTILGRPTVWRVGRRVQTGLHRAARQARLGQLISAPLLQGPASFGLLALAYRESPPPEILALTQTLAAILTTVYDVLALQDKVVETQQANQRAIQISRVLEHESRDGLLIFNAGLKLLQINPAAEAMLQFTGSEVRGFDWKMLLIGSRELEAALAALVQGQSEARLAGVQLYRRGGASFLANVRLLRLDHGRSLDRVLVLVEDLSAQQQLQERLQDLEQRASLGQITSVFAHEVGNPINNLMSGVDRLALKFSADDPRQEILSRMMDDCERIDALMKSVLGAARNQVREQDMTRVEIRPLLEGLLAGARRRLDEAKVTAQLDVGRDTPPVWGNRRAVEQIFTNLVNNAVQEMQAHGGGRLALQAKLTHPPLRSQAFVEISVADSGPGIPPEFLSQIFKPYFSTHQHQQGTGLGLAITQQLVNQHKGQIEVKSFTGGTVFTVLLPAAPSDKGCA